MEFEDGLNKGLRHGCLAFMGFRKGYLRIPMGWTVCFLWFTDDTPFARMDRDGDLQKKAMTCRPQWSSDGRKHQKQIDLHERECVHRLQLHCQQPLLLKTGSELISIKGLRSSLTPILHSLVLSEL